MRYAAFFLALAGLYLLFSNGGEYYYFKCLFSVFALGAAAIIMIHIGLERTYGNGRN